MSINNQTDIRTKNECKSLSAHTHSCVGVQSTPVSNTSVTDKLPDIDAKGQARARSKAASWAMPFWDVPIGYIHEDDAGVIWQVVNRGTLRCLSVWDHAYYYETLASMVLALQEVGLTVEVDPYTVILQLPETVRYEPTSTIETIEVV